MLTITTTGEQVDFFSASINGSIDNFSFDAQFEVKDFQDYRLLKPLPGGYTAVSLNIFGIIFHLIIEDGSRSWSVDSNGQHTEQYTLTARSRTALLDKTHIKPITKNWANTTAKTIVQELCAIQGVILDWQVNDWIVKNYSVANAVLIDVIIEIVGEKGTMAIVQPSLDGKLVVCLRDKISPAKYADHEPEHILTDTNNLFSLSEKRVERGKYGWIEIANEAVSTEVKVNFETVEEGDSLIIKAFVVPFKRVNFQHSGVGYVNALYEGVFTELVTDDVTVIDGKGSVSKPCYQVQSVVYLHTDLGNVTVTETGEMLADVAGHGLATITYTTKYHQYRATAKIGDKALGYVT